MKSLIILERQCLMEQTKLEGADDITDACIASQRNLEKLDTLEDHCKDIKRGSPSPVLHSNGHLWVQWSVWAVSHRRDVAAPTGQTKGKEGKTQAVKVGTGGLGTGILRRV